MSTQTVKVAMLPPEALLAAENIRFGLKKFRVQALAESILQLGEVTTPLHVSPLKEKGPGGEDYLIREGHYRQAAALQVNKDGAGILLPCIIEDEDVAEGVSRLDHQVSENMDRENLSPMDLSVVIRKYLDAGLAKVDIRQKLQTSGGRKGSTMEPLSNAMLNIYLSFQDFPKKIQNLIHEGILPVSEAYKLTRKPKDKWDAIIDQAMKDHQAEYDTQTKWEEEWLGAQKKEEEARLKAEAEKVAIEKAAENAKVATETLESKLAGVEEAFKAVNKLKAKGSKEEKAKAEEILKAREAEVKEAEKVAEAAKKEADKLQEKAAKNAELAAERAKKLEAARKEAEKKAKLKGGAVDKAAAKVEAGGPVALTATEMRKYVNDLCLPGSFPKVIRIGKSFQKAYAGIITDQQLLSELAYITGERKERPKTMKDGE